MFRAVRPRFPAAVTVFGLSAIAAIAGTAHASWTVTYLSPNPGGSSRAFGVQGNMQVGHTANGASTDFLSAAALWNSTSSSWLSLHPSDAEGSTAYGLDGPRQIGTANFGTDHAGFWNGSAASWSDIHPSAAISSRAYAGSNGYQAGYAEIAPNQQHASLWHGDSGSWVDLHPAAASISYANDIDNGQQAGLAYFGGVSHAGIWSGTASSFVDLNPAGSSESWANANHNGRQVGAAHVSGLNPHAALWNGTAASWIDLSPPAKANAYSAALDVWDNWQAGFVYGGKFGLSVASVWNGSAASWEDLSLALPNTWVATYAQSVWSDGTMLFVAGYGFNLNTSQDEALLWSRPIPAPSAILLFAPVAIMRRRR
jgi:hypothetical protein